METQTLYRPVGLKELELIAASGWRAFPPRLDWQPIFYPVLSEDYAAQIAREWNVPDAFSGFLGAVTCFALPADFLSRYEIQNVGGSLHNELWVPAEELSAFNDQITGPITVTQAFFGAQFDWPEDEAVRDVLRRFC